MSGSPSAFGIIGSGPIGAYQYISSVVASSSSQILFTNLNSAYCKYVIECVDVLMGTNGANFLLQYSANNGNTFVTSGYEWSDAFLQFTSSPSWNASGSASDTSIQITGDISNTLAFDASIVLYNPATLSQPRINASVNLFPVSPGNFQNVVGGICTTTGPMNAVQLIPSTGVITSGVFNLYGVANSSVGSPSAAGPFFWVFYNAQTQTVLGSMNVSGVTYNGPGDYTISLIKPYSSINNCPVIGSIGPVGLSAYVCMPFSKNNGTNSPVDATRSTSSVRVTMVANGIGFGDAASVSIVGFGG